MVYAMVLLPVPAEPGPLIQKTRAVCILSPPGPFPGDTASPSSTQWWIMLRILVLVPSWQGLNLSLQSYRAVMACGSTDLPLMSHQVVRHNADIDTYHKHLASS